MKGKVYLHLEGIVADPKTGLSFSSESNFPSQINRQQEPANANHDVLMLMDVKIPRKLILSIVNGWYALYTLVIKICTDVIKILN